MQILFEDQNIIAVNKPAGLLSVPGRGIEKIDSVEHRIRQKYPSAMAVHRLDMATSGVLLLSKHKEAERYFKNCFATRQTQKTYQALCRGQFENQTGSIDLPLRCDWENRPKQMVCHEHGKPSLTHYQVLTQYQNHARLELTPITGRSHQLRVHLSAIHHPIIGDTFYGIDEDKNKPRLLLHAERLIIPNLDGNPLELYAPTPF